MSLILVHDQEHLYKNAKPIVTEFTDIHPDYELIKVEKRKTAKQIRQEYLRSNLDPVQKAMDKGAKYVRKYYNDKNLRLRKK